MNKRFTKIDDRNTPGNATENEQHISGKQVFSNSCSLSVVNTTNSFQPNEPKLNYKNGYFVLDGDNSKGVRRAIPKTYSKAAGRQSEIRALTKGRNASRDVECKNIIKKYKQDMKRSLHDIKSSQKSLLEYYDKLQYQRYTNRRHSLQPVSSNCCRAIDIRRRHSVDISDSNVSVNDNLVQKKDIKISGNLPKELIPNRSWLSEESAAQQNKFPVTCKCNDDNSSKDDDSLEHIILLQKSNIEIANDHAFIQTTSQVCNEDICNIKRENYSPSQTVSEKKVQGQTLNSDSTIKTTKEIRDSKRYESQQINNKEPLLESVREEVECDPSDKATDHETIIERFALLKKAKANAKRRKTIDFSFTDLIKMRSLSDYTKLFDTVDRLATQQLEERKAKLNNHNTRKSVVVPVIRKHRDSLPPIQVQHSKTKGTGHSLETRASTGSVVSKYSVLPDVSGLSKQTRDRQSRDKTNGIFENRRHSVPIKGPIFTHKNASNSHRELLNTYRKRIARLDIYENEDMKDITRQREISAIKTVDDVKDMAYLRISTPNFYKEEVESDSDELYT